MIGPRANFKPLLLAGLPGLIVLVAHSLAGELLGHEPYVDPVMHISGGGAAAFFFYRTASIYEERIGALTVLGSCLFAVGMTAVAALFWEFAEYLSDLYLSTTTHTSIGSTLRDLFNGLLGASAYVTWRSRGFTRGKHAAV